MTPEEIVNQIINSSKKDFGRQDGVEAIKQWGREMCDNQKELCASHANEFPKHYLGAIITAPYPKELE